MKPLNDVNKGNDVKNQPVEEMMAEPEQIDFSKAKIEPLFEEMVYFDTFSKSDFRAVKVKECVAVPVSYTHLDVYKRQTIIFFDWEGDGVTDPTGIVQRCANGTRSEERRVGKECRSRW